MSDERRDGPRGRKAIEEMEARLGDLFDRLGETLGTIAGPAGEGRDAGATGPVRVHSDVRIRFGGLDEGRGWARAPHRGREARGEDAPGPARPAAESREPVFETEDADGVWTLIAEMPGAEPDSLDISARDGVLLIEGGGARRYVLRCPLPAHVDPGGIAHRLANGIVELRAPWRDGRGQRP